MFNMKKFKLFSSKKYNPKPRWGHSTATIGNKMIVWGGTHSGLPEEHTSDLKTKLTSILEVFDIEKGTWVQETTVGQPPLGVRGHCSAVIDADVYYFGGYCGHDWCRHNTLHCLDTVNNVWRSMTPNNPGKGPMKKSRCGMVAFTDNGRQYLCVFGGTGHLSSASQPNATYIPWKENPSWGWTNETHIFDFETGLWITPYVTGDVPPACAGFTLTRISANKAILCGGFQPQMGGCVSDVFVMKLSKHKVHWSKVMIGNDNSDGGISDDTIPDYHHPVGRQDHTCVCMSPDRTTLMIMGGRDPGGNTLNDCWLLDLTHNEWRQVFYLETIAYRHFHSTSVFHLSATCLLVVVFGGVRGWIPGKSTKHQPAISATTIIEASDASCEGSWDLRVVRDEHDTSPSQEYHQLIQQYLSDDSKVVVDQVTMVPPSPSPSRTSSDRSSISHSSASKLPAISIYEDILDNDKSELHKHLKPMSPDDMTDGRISRIETRKGSPSHISGPKRGSEGSLPLSPPPVPPKTSPQHSLDGDSSSRSRRETPPLPPKSLPNSFDQIPPLPSKNSKEDLAPAPPARRSSLSLNKMPPSLPPKHQTRNGSGDVPPLPPKVTEESPPPLPVKHRQRVLSPDNDPDITGSTRDLAKHGGTKHKPLVSNYVWTSAPSIRAINSRSMREDKTESIGQSINDISLLKNLRDNDRNIIQSLEQQLAMAISRSDEIEEQLHTAVLRAEERAVMAEENMRQMETQLIEVQDRMTIYRQSLSQAQTKACLAYAEATDNSSDILKLQQQVLMAEERAISAEELLERTRKEKEDAIEDSRKSYLLTTQMDAKIKDMERLMLKVEGEIQIAEDRVLEEKKTNEQLKRKEVSQLLIKAEYVKPSSTQDPNQDQSNDENSMNFIKRSTVTYCGSTATQLTFTDYMDDMNDQWNILESLLPLSRLRHPNIVQFMGATSSVSASDEADHYTNTVLMCTVSVLIDYIPSSLDTRLSGCKTCFTLQQTLSVAHDILSALVYLSSIEVHPFLKTKLRPKDVLLLEAGDTCISAKLSFVEHIVLSASISDKLSMQSLSDLSAGSVIKDFGYILLSMITGQLLDADSTPPMTDSSSLDSKDNGHHQGLSRIANRCIEDHSIINLNDLLTDISSYS